MAVVVPVVEELVEAVTCLLSFSHEQKVMSYFFIRGMLEGVNRKMGNLLYVRVVDNEIVEIHDKKTKHLVVLKVIATHLVKGKLGLEDIVAEIQDDEAMVDELDHAEPCLWQALDVLLSELVGLDVHDQLVDVPAVKRYDILLNELFLRIVEFAVSALLPPLLVLLLLTRPNHIVFNLLRKQSRELLVEDLADDAMCNN